jgi:hypothetical protein
MARATTHAAIAADVAIVTKYLLIIRFPSANPRCRDLLAALFLNDDETGDRARAVTLELDEVRAQREAGL